MLLVGGKDRPLTVIFSVLCFEPAPLREGRNPQPQISARVLAGHKLVVRTHSNDLLHTIGRYLSEHELCNTSAFSMHTTYILSSKASCRHPSVQEESSTYIQRVGRGTATRCAFLRTSASVQKVAYYSSSSTRTFLMMQI